MWLNQTGKSARLLASGWCLCLGLYGSSAWGGPVTIVRSDADPSHFRPMPVLFQQGDAWVVRDPDATDRDFEDLYVVNLHQHFAIPDDISGSGEVLEFLPGRFAVMRMTEQDVETVAGRLHASGMACGLFTKLDGSEMELASPKPAVPRIPVVTKDDRIAALVAKVDAASIKTTIDQLAAIPSRFHQAATGKTVADVLAERYQALKAGREDVTVTTYDHKTATPQRSLIVRIEGRTKPEEVLILGSHLDSVNWQDGSGSRAPGADDNASGTATNVEIFRVLMAEGVRPERTVEIHAYAAEEIGLVGSQDIAQAYRRNGRKVVAMVQHDMTLYKAPGTEDKIWLVTSNTDDGLNSQLGTLIDTYVGMPWAKRALYNGSSDHASWKRAGFVAAFPFENPSQHNPHIHTAGDTTAQAQAFDQSAGFAKLGMAFLTHFAGMAI